MDRGIKPGFPMCYQAYMLFHRYNYTETQVVIKDIYRNFSYFSWIRLSSPFFCKSCSITLAFLTTSLGTDFENANQ